jgi:predicted transcriptional regulator
MDLVSAITNFDQSAAIGSVQMAVAKKVLDMQQFQGDAAVKLIQAAEQSMNSSGDALVAAATGLGGKLDTYA